MDEKENEIKEEISKNNVTENVNEKDDKKGKKTLWAIIIIIFILVIGIIVFATIKSKECNDVDIPDGSSGGTYINPNGNSGISPVDIKKPIIYLYPEKTEEITIKLGYPEKITCSYPKYEDEWSVIANPDGTLKEIKTGKNLYSLYWEGIGTAKTNMQEGFIIKGEDSAEFLEEKLVILGLTEREAEEFIIYWLPKLESNKYNYIRFASLEEINQYMPLDFSVKPDSLIRVLMQFKGLDEPIKVEKQKLETPKRNGFVAVEWGGSEIK